MDYEKAYKEALERARQIKDGKDEWRYSDLAEITPALTEIFPELRESEDERIRKAIIELLKEVGRDDTGISENAKCMIAYLEKQKINIEGDFGRGYDCGYQAGYAVAMNKMKPKVATATLDSEKQKEQKPELVQHPPITYTYPSDASRDERLKAALLALLNSDLLKVKEGGYFTKQDLIEWAERIPTDKPVDSNDMINAILSALASGLETDEILKARGFTYDEVEKWLDSTRNPAIEYIRGQNKIFENPEKYGLCKLVEYGDDIVEDAEEYTSKVNCGEYGVGVTEAYIAGALRERSKKPVARENDFVSKEWSEEDEEMMTDIIESLEYAYPNDNEFRIAWLKSLRPSWKPSEEDIKMLEHIIGQYETWNKNSKVMGYLPRVEELNFLKKVLSKWKN